MTSADLDSHHIEGHTAGGHVRIPLISEILPGLWMGGCIDGVRLPDDFGFVLSLYPWEQYKLGPETERREVRLYDSAEIPGPERLAELAALVDMELLRNRKVLVHCQAGLNRSGLVTSLALMRSGSSAADAIALLREKRSPLVLCNGVFEKWLLAHDALEGAA